MPPVGEQASRSGLGGLSPGTQRGRGPAKVCGVPLCSVRVPGPSRTPASGGRVSQSLARSRERQGRGWSTEVPAGGGGRAVGRPWPDASLRKCPSAAGESQKPGCPPEEADRPVSVQPRLAQLLTGSGLWDTAGVVALGHSRGPSAIALLQREPWRGRLHRHHSPGRSLPL